MVGVVGNLSLIACWHCPNIGRTIKFKQLLILLSLILQLHTNSDFLVVVQMMGQLVLADCNRVIFLNIIVISISCMQKLFNFVYNNSVILFNKNNLSVNLKIILNNFIYFKLGKILESFVKLLWMFCKNLLITHRILIIIYLLCPLSDI